MTNKTKLHHWQQNPLERKDRTHTEVQLQLAQVYMVSSMAGGR